MMAARLGATGSWIHTMRFVHPVGDSAAPVAPGAYRAGFVSGGPRCVSCRDRDGTEHERTEPERRAQAARDLEARLDALGRETATDAIRRQLLEVAFRAPPYERMVEPWRRVAADPASLPFGPTHDIVTVRGRRSRLGRLTWEEVDRHQGWNVHAERRTDAETTHSGSVVLDAEGGCWSIWGAPHPSSDRDAFAVVRRGAPCVVKVERRARKGLRTILSEGRWVASMTAPHDLAVTLPDAIRCVLQDRPDSYGIENANT